MVPFRLLSMSSLALGATIALEVPMPEVSTTEHEAETEVLTSDELLVEEVSIDGMCGVY
jgi:mycofactocin precursor